MRGTVLNRKLKQLGLETNGFLYNQPLFEVRLPDPDQNRLFGVIVSQEMTEFSRKASRLPASDEKRMDDENAFGFASSCVGVVETVVPPVHKDDPNLTARQRDMMAMIHDFGMEAGCTFPVVDRKRKTFSTYFSAGLQDRDDYLAFMENHGTTVWAGITYFHEGMAARDISETKKGPLLSPREEDCLAWTAAGRSAKQISDILKIAESTVNEYIRSACKKTRCHKQNPSRGTSIVNG